MQGLITSICLNDPIEKHGANDATAPPNRGDVAEVQVPFVLPAGPTNNSIPCAYETILEA